jgi:hypothetical protein
VKIGKIEKNSHVMVRHLGICYFIFILIAKVLEASASTLRPARNDAAATRETSNSDNEEENVIWDRLLQNFVSLPPTLSPTNAGSPTTPTPTIQMSPTLPPSAGQPCGITPAVRSELLTNIAEQVSGPIAPGSYQERALNWLIGQDEYFVCPDNPQAIQRYILAAFYYATQGDNWEECSAPTSFSDPGAIAAANANCSITTTPIPGGNRNPLFLPTTEGDKAWLTPVYECEWAGITCRVETNCVDRIEFERNRLGGILPFELRDLDDLRFLILERGTIQGTIPVEFGEYFMILSMACITCHRNFLSNTCLDATNATGDIEDLVFLDMDFNQLEGTIPDQIYEFANLVQLDLNNNLLSGTISPLIGNLRNLVFFQISENDFSGTLPPEIRQLSSLGKFCFFCNATRVLNSSLGTYVFVS